MTTTTAIGSRRSSTSTARWSFGGALSSEVTKLTTLRSTYVISIVMVGISVAFAALVSSTYDNFGESNLTATGATAQAIGSSVSFAQLVIGVLAILLVSNEYSTNMIQTTLGATPRRLAVLAAKTIVGATLTVILSGVSSIASYFASAPLLASHDLLAPLGDPKVIGAIVGSAVYLLFVALFSIMVASIVRNSAAGIAIMAGVFFVLPIVLSLVPAGDFQPSSYILGYTGQMVSQGIWDHSYTPHMARNIVVTVAWLVIPAIAAGALLKRRDA